MALAGCGEDGVGDGRADRSDPRLANAGGRVARRNDMDLDPRHVVDAQDLVAVEVGLLDLAFLQRDRARQRRTQAGRFAPACAGFRSYRPAVGAENPVNYPGVRADEESDGGNDVTGQPAGTGCQLVVHC